MYWLMILLVSAGLALFIFALGNTRARIPGLVAFALWLAASLLGLLRPQVVYSGSWWVVLDQVGSLACLLSDVLLLGAVYGLRNAPTPTAAGAERLLARVAGMVFLVWVTLAIVVGRRIGLGSPWLAIGAAELAVALLALVGVAVRFGVTAAAGLTGLAGFACLAARAGVGVALDSQLLRHEDVPRYVTQGLTALALALIIAAFALAAKDPQLERQPFPESDTVGMNRPRWAGLTLVVLGIVLLPVLSHAATEIQLFLGLRGRAAVAALALLALPLYGALRGTALLTLGRPLRGRVIWS